MPEDNDVRRLKDILPKEILGENLGDVQISKRTPRLPAHSNRW